MRIRQKVGRLAVALTLSLGLAAISYTAQANPIGIFNTGVDGTGTVLPNATLGDPHYSLISSPGTTSIRVATSAIGYPIPPWVGDNLLSRWIGPVGDDDLDGPSGTYTYRKIGRAHV